MSPTARIERDSAWPEISFEERIGTAEFRIHEKAHITVNGDSCRGCTTRECVVACPANLFVPTAAGGIEPSWTAGGVAAKSVSHCRQRRSPGSGPSLTPGLGGNSGTTPRSADASASSIMLANNPGSTTGPTPKVKPMRVCGIGSVPSSKSLTTSCRS